MFPPADAVVRELAFVEVRFSTAVSGVDAADLVVNGQPATGVSEPAEALLLFELPALADGPVEVAWREGHGIASREEPALPFVGGAWKYTLDSAAPPSGLMIAEFLADNRRTLNDEDGEASDWIELFNPEDSPVSVAGWFLTDDPLVLTKWAFPDVGVPGQGRLLAFASGRTAPPPPPGCTRTSSSPTPASTWRWSPRAARWSPSSHRPFPGRPPTSPTGGSSGSRRGGVLRAPDPRGAQRELGPGVCPGRELFPAGRHLRRAV